MIEYDLDTEHSILHVQPKSAIEQDDFVKIAKAVDPHIEANGGLAGLIVEAPAFPGLKSFAVLGQDDHATALRSPVSGVAGAMTFGGTARFQRHHIGTGRAHRH